MFDRFQDKKFVLWSKRVKERDRYRCQICYKRRVSLHSHHINAWNKFTKHRYDLDNGITLCTTCHERFHTIYGKGDNTMFQFKEFMEIIKVIRKIVKTNPVVIILPESSTQDKI